MFLHCVDALRWGTSSLGCHLLQVGRAERSASASHRVETAVSDAGTSPEGLVADIANHPCKNILSEVIHHLQFLTPIKVFNLSSSPICGISVYFGVSDNCFPTSFTQWITVVWCAPFSVQLHEKSCYWRTFSDIIVWFHLNNWILLHKHQ